MNVFRALWRWLRGASHLIVVAMRYAESRGLTDDLLNTALALVIQGDQLQFIDHDERREWVVHELRQRTKVPMSVARLAVELAVNAYKAHILRHILRSTVPSEP